MSFPIKLFKFARSKKEKRVAILDIGSSSVGGAIVLLKEDGKPNVIYSTRKEIAFQDKLDFERFFTLMLKTLKSVLVEMEKVAGGPPKSFFCLLSSPWYTSATRIVNVSKDKPFTVTPQIVDMLIESEARAMSTAVGTNKKTGEEESEIMDIQNIQIKLNGYETSNPYDKSVRNIEIALFISMSSKRVLDSVKKEIFKIFHSRHVRFSSFALVALSTLRDIFTDKDDFLFMDVTGEVTDVSIIRNNVLMETISFPLGKNFLTREAMKGLSATPEEAMSMLTMYREGTSAASTARRLESILSDARKKWLTFFADSLRNLSRELSVPNTVFLAASQDIAWWFAKSIEKGKFDQSVFAGDSLNVKLLDKKILSGFCDVNPRVKKDPFIMLEAIFSNKTLRIGPEK
ncbi:MAG: hypothetical protein BMS9Abin13_074 [Patescibacteria group bacterium]|nr:MAG: hypothetical protein BMS9Abin13_074 [Patescibacteria group bacterium]